MEIDYLSYQELITEISDVLNKYRDAGMIESDIQYALNTELEISYDIEEYGK